MKDEAVEQHSGPANARETIHSWNKPRVLELIWYIKEVWFVTHPSHRQVA